MNLNRQGFGWLSVNAVQNLLVIPKANQEPKEFGIEDV